MGTSKPRTPFAEYRQQRSSTCRYSAKGVRGLLLQEVFHAPLDRFFGLRAIFGEALGEEAPAVKQGDGHHGQAQVGSGANGVARKNAESAAVARHGIL